MISAKLIQKEIAALEKQYNRIQRARRNLPKERLYVRKRRGHNRYYTISLDSNGVRKENYMSLNDRARFRSLAAELYLGKLEQTVATEIDLLSSFSNAYKPYEKYDNWQGLPTEVKNCVSPIFKTNEQLIEEWLQEEFIRSDMPNRDEGLYVTKHGESVRSRIELIVANELDDLGIPYRYECALDLNQSKRIYPDFTVLHPQTLELWYIELFGMMADQDYVAHNMRKIQEYYIAGLQPRMIALYDHPDARLAVPMVRKMLKEIFLVEI